MKKLFMITLGGRISGGHSEIHDVQYIIAQRIEDTYKVLKDHWSGLDIKLHIDAYKELKVIDGYKVSITDTKDQKHNIYSAFAGAYDKERMLELHEIGLFVSANENQAKVRASKECLQGFQDIHVDDLINIQDAKLLNALEKGYISLTETDLSYDLVPDWHGYFRLDKV